MAVVYLDRFTFPVGRFRRELVYVNNVVNDDVVKINLSKIYSASIALASGVATATTDPSVTINTSGGREVVTIRDPDGVTGTVYEIDVLGQ